jgi:hypothetical protein
VPTPQERAQVEQQRQEKAQPPLSSILMHAQDYAGNVMSIIAEFDSQDIVSAPSGNFSVSNQPLNRFWVYQDGSRCVCEFHPSKFNYIPDDEALCDSLANVVPTLTRGMKLKLTGKVISPGFGEQEGHFVVGKIERF